jgi:hypothetical protein
VRVDRTSCTTALRAREQLFGLGGVLVEVAGRPDGALLPLGDADARALVERVAGAEAFARLRGHTRWDPEPLVAAVEAVGRVWEQNAEWLASADLNPLVVTADGVVVVDALLRRRRGRAEASGSSAGPAPRPYRVHDQSSGPRHHRHLRWTPPGIAATPGRPTVLSHVAYITRDTDATADSVASSPERDRQGSERATLLEELAADGDEAVLEENR